MSQKQKLRNLNHHENKTLGDNNTTALCTRWPTYVPAQTVSLFSIGHAWLLVPKTFCDWVKVSHVNVGDALLSHARGRSCHHLPREFVRSPTRSGERDPMRMG